MGILLLIYRWIIIIVGYHYSRWPLSQCVSMQQLLAGVVGSTKLAKLAFVSSFTWFKHRTDEWKWYLVIIMMMSTCYSMYGAEDTKAGRTTQAALTAGCSKILVYIIYLCYHSCQWLCNFFPSVIQAMRETIIVQAWWGSWTAIYKIPDDSTSWCLTAGVLETVSATMAYCSGGWV